MTAEQWVNNQFSKQIINVDIYASKEGIIKSHEHFALLEKQKMYSEEDLKSAFFNGGDMKDLEEFNYWLEKFKKKKL